mgnify:FL=1
MFYKYFTKEERQYIIDCWELFKNEGKDGIDTNYRNRIDRFNLKFYRNELKQKFPNIDSYIGVINNNYSIYYPELSTKINKFFCELNYKDDRLRIAKECFGFDMGLFEGFSMDVIDLIDYKFKSNQINTLEDAYNCYKEYNNFLGKKDTLEDYMKSVDTKLKEIGDDLIFDKKYIRNLIRKKILNYLMKGLKGIVLLALLTLFIYLFESGFYKVLFFIGAIGACLKILF